jgi:GntR family transcriptional regulator / MocR family aminotransferase
MHLAGDDAWESLRLVLLRSLEAELSAWLTPWPSSAGLHIAVNPKGRFLSQGVVQCAARLGVAVQSLGDHGVALGYGAIESNQIDEGLDV